jgi:protein required for attachment to host cells
MERTWVVVAESSRARIFEASGQGAELQELSDLVHPASRLKGQALMSDSPGRAFDSKGRGRHAMSQETDVRRNESKIFADEIANQLEAGRTGGKFGRLILVAPPEFLGLLRASLGPETAGLVAATVNKNIARLKPEEIRKHLDV